VPAANPLLAVVGSLMLLAAALFYARERRWGITLLLTVLSLLTFYRNLW
jgi:hypothetical protein